MDDTDTNTKNHEVEAVAEGHEVQIYCGPADPREPEAKHIFQIRNNTHKLADRVHYCPHCGRPVEVGGV